MTRRWASAGSPFMAPLYTGKRRGQSSAPAPAKAGAQSSTARFGQMGPGLRRGRGNSYENGGRSLAAAPEPAAVEIARYDLQHDLAETFNRLRPGFGIGALDALALILRQLALEIDPSRRELQQALAAVAFAGVLDDEALAHELAQHPR